MRRFRLNPLHRFLLVLGGGIVLPAALLAYVGFRQIVAQPKASRVLLEASYRELLDSKADLIESLLKGGFQKHAESVRGTSLDEIVDSLRGLQDKVFVQHPFLMRRGRGVIYPPVPVLRRERGESRN